jgi:hypothetical protein
MASRLVRSMDPSDGTYFYEALTKIGPDISLSVGGNIILVANMY